YTRKKGKETIFPHSTGKLLLILPFSCLQKKNTTSLKGKMEEKVRKHPLLIRPSESIQPPWLPDSIDPEWWIQHNSTEELCYRIRRFEREGHNFYQYMNQLREPEIPTKELVELLEQVLSRTFPTTTTTTTPPACQLWSGPFSVIPSQK